MDEDDFISKTRRKRQAHDLQDLGKALTGLSAEALARIEMPEKLREAVLACKRFSKHEAVRRQLQYIGRLMRDIDAAPIAAELAARSAPSHRRTALMHLAERWRDDLLADPAAAQRFAAEFPAADAARLRALAEAALAERHSGKPPRRGRELFRAVEAVVRAGREEGA